MMFRKERHMSRAESATARALAPHDSGIVVLAPRLSLNLAFARILRERAAAPASPSAGQHGAVTARFALAGRRMSRAESATVGALVPHDSGTVVVAPGLSLRLALARILRERALAPASPSAGEHRAATVHFAPAERRIFAMQPWRPSAAGAAATRLVIREWRRGASEPLLAGASRRNRPAQRGFADAGTTAMAPAATYPARISASAEAAQCRVLGARLACAAERAPARLYGSFFTVPGSAAAPAAGPTPVPSVRAIGGRAVQIRPVVRCKRRAGVATGARAAAQSPAAHRRLAGAPEHAVLRAPAPASPLARFGAREPRRKDWWRSAATLAAAPVPQAARRVRYPPPPTAVPGLTFAPPPITALAAAAAPPAAAAMLDYRRPSAAQETKAVAPALPSPQPAPPRAAIDLDSLSREMWQRFDRRIRLEAERYGRA
jgi:hypothetical protein